MPKTIKLHPGEHIAAVVPESPRGPGWANTLAWVHIHNNGTRTFRTEAIQLLSGEATPELMTLHHVGQVLCAALLAAVPVKKIKEQTP
jgi:hypothetical protein